MAKHRLWLDSSPGGLRPGQTVLIEGEEAWHAVSVKRVAPGEEVELLDGQGHRATAQVQAVEGKKGRARLVALVGQVQAVAEPAPRLTVLTAVPKGGRVDDMIDQLSQAGAAAWGPLHATRSVVDPRPAKLDRLERIAIEAAKQCGRGRALAVLPPCSLADALRPEPGVGVLVADGSGVVADGLSAGGTSLRLLVGPEGGWTDEELGQARAAGAGVVRFGPHIMRIETAAVVAAGVLMSRSG